VVRPGYLPGPAVALDPIRMGVVWEDAPQRILPSTAALPRQPVRAIAFARVLRSRPDVLHRLVERGSAVLVILDDPAIAPADLGLDGSLAELRLTVALPILPAPLGNGQLPSIAWSGSTWGAILGLFPFPGAEQGVDTTVAQLKAAGARFAVGIPLLLTPKDRHRILDGCDGTEGSEPLENSLFHADVSRGLLALERRAGVAVHRAGMDQVVDNLVPLGLNPGAVRTAAELRLWARRLDQCQEESSWGWRLRRAATALERLPNDPALLAAEDNLRVVPGMDPWVESFTRALWSDGEPILSAWRMWSGTESDASDAAAP
jgi:hypothetical protein